MKNILRLAVILRKDIGKHYQMIGQGISADAYYEAQAASDRAVSLADYLIQHLQDKNQAEIFANAVGMPGYFYKYKG